MYMRLREKKAFTLVEIMIVVAIIGLLVAIAVPNFVRARRTARSNLCMNNMRLLGHAAEQYIIDENMDSWGATALASITEYIKGGVPSCPQDVSVDPAYSIADSDETDGVVVTCLVNADHGTYDTGAPEAGLE